MSWSKVAFCLLTSLLLSLPSHSKDGILASSGEISVSEQDIILALAPVPKDKRTSIVSNPKLMSQIIERVLFNRILASRAEASEEPVSMSEDSLIRDARLADVYMNKAVGSPPDFSRFAAERYASDPEQWRIPAKKLVQLLRVEDKKLSGELPVRYSAEEFVKLAENLGVKIQDFSIGADREKDFDPSFWGLVTQLQFIGDIRVLREEPAAFVVRLQATEQSRLRSREEAIPLITSQLEADWRKAQTDRIMAELRQLEVAVDGAAVIALRDRVLREEGVSQ